MTSWFCNNGRGTQYRFYGRWQKTSLVKVSHGGRYRFYCLGRMTSSKVVAQIARTMANWAVYNNMLPALCMQWYFASSNEQKRCLSLFECSTQRSVDIAMISGRGCDCVSKNCNGLNIVCLTDIALMTNDGEQTGTGQAKVMWKIDIVYRWWMNAHCRRSWRRSGSDKGQRSSRKRKGQRVIVSWEPYLFRRTRSNYWFTVPVVCAAADERQLESRQSEHLHL